MSVPLPPVPPLPPELTQLARWLILLRASTIASVTPGSDYLRVTDAPYNAVGDGVTDDSDAIQRALTYATTNGLTVFFPSGTYKVTAPLVVNTGTSWAHHGPRASLKGAGSSNTRILFTGAGTLLSVGGFGAQYFVDIDGLYFQGDGTVDETGHPAIDGYGTNNGLLITASSWASIKNCVIAGFATGLHITESFSNLIENSYVRTNLNGVLLDGATYAHPNAITLVSSGISENKNYGIYAALATALNIHGGSVEANGIGGSGSFVGGMYVSGGPDGAAQVSATGVYFENNAGTADVFLDNASNSGASCFSGCTFNRISGTTYVTNNIVVSAASGKTNTVSVQGCGFNGFNTYTPNSGRPYITTAGVGDARVSWAGCFFGSATETPTIPNYITETPTNSIVRVIYTGGVGTNTPALPLTTCPAPGPAQWVELTTDAIVGSGTPGFWVLGVPG